MHWLCGIGDGSAGALANGYWLLEACLLLRPDLPLPLLLEPFSQKQPGLTSQNSLLLVKLHTLAQATGRRSLAVAVSPC